MRPRLFAAEIIIWIFIRQMYSDGFNEAAAFRRGNLPTPADPAPGDRSASMRPRLLAAEINECLLCGLVVTRLQ